MVFVGAATWDAIALVDHFPTPDGRQVAERVQFAGGGPAATAAVAAARLGVAACFVGAVGDDGDGERIVSDLSSEGVDVTGVQRVPMQPSGASVVIVDSARGTRAICNQPAPRLDLDDDATSRLVRDADWVHVDHAGWGPVQHVLARMPTGRRPRLSVDAGNPILGLDLRAVDLYVPTYEALVARYPTEGQSPDEPLTRALADGAGTVVATRGGDGAVAATADGARAEVAGLRIGVVSTLGAGDVFHGALVAAVVRGFDLPDQIDYANAAAALSCRGLDGRSEIPSHHEVLDLVPVHHAYDRDKLEPLHP